MARPAPGVSRTVAILNFLAEHPRDAFTLTDIVRSLHINPATCHATLSALVQSGYLYRSTRKTYKLGPALVALSQIAQDNFSPAEVARDEIRRLADQFDLVCIASVRIGNEMQILERAVPVSKSGSGLYPVGLRFPITPPQGASFIAWSGEDDQEGWINLFDPPVSSVERQRIRRAIARARARGYSLGMRIDSTAEMQRALVELQRNEADLDRLAERLGQREYLPVDLEPGETYLPSYMGAPIFDSMGDVVLVLALIGFEKAMTGEEIERAAKQLRAACDRATETIGGTSPEGLAALEAAD